MEGAVAIYSMHPEILLCVTPTLIDATNLRCKTSTDKTMTRGWGAQEQEIEIEIEKPKDVMQMQSKVARCQLAVKSGSMHLHLPRNPLISVLGHPVTKMTVLDEDTGWMYLLQYHAIQRLVSSAQYTTQAEEWHYGGPITLLYISSMSIYNKGI
jgi:hypothetical protein